MSGEQIHDKVGKTIRDTIRRSKKKQAKLLSNCASEKKRMFVEKTKTESISVMNSSEMAHPQERLQTYQPIPLSSHVDDRTNRIRSLPYLNTISVNVQNQSLLEINEYDYSLKFEPIELTTLQRHYSSQQSFPKVKESYEPNDDEKNVDDEFVQVIEDRLGPLTYEDHLLYYDFTRNDDKC